MARTLDTKHILSLLLLVCALTRRAAVLPLNTLGRGLNAKHPFSV